MGAVYTSSTFTDHYEYRLRSILYPFRDDPALGKLIIRYFEGSADTYTAPTLNATDSEFTDAYLVGVGSMDHTDGRLMRYEKRYATIPASRSEWESYAFRFPGFNTSETLGSTLAITQMFVNNIAQTARRFVTAHGYSEGDIVFENITWQRATGSTDADYTYVTTTSNKQVITQVDANSYVAPIYVPQGGSGPGQFVGGTVAKVGTSYGARGPATRIVASRRQLDYFLPGVSSGVTSPRDIYLEPGIQFVDATGTEVDVLTTTTSPTQAGYTEGITNSREFVVESLLRNWLGNIYEREVRFLPYL